MMAKRPGVEYRARPLREIAAAARARRRKLVEGDPEAERVRADLGAHAIATVASVYRSREGAA
jgi:hypothetical protein